MKKIWGVKMARKLVTFREVRDIQQIERADVIELCLIDGWQCVTVKDTFKVGDIGAYFEVDSFLPEKPEFEFLRPSSFRNMGEEKGFRLKTIRLRGALSQGLLLPLSPLGLTGNEDEETLADRLGVKLWESPLAAELSGVARSLFPSFIPKTDQERVQNLTGKLWGEGRTITYTDAEGNEIVKNLPAAVKRKYEVSEKADGSSTTFYDYEGNFGVCSRNLDLLEDENNTFWKMANKYNLKERLKGTNKALQGETVGSNIQGNPYKMKDQEVFIFDIYDIEKQRYLSPEERGVFMAEIVPDMKSVPILARYFEIPDTLEALLEYVQGKSVLNPLTEREGLVFKEEGESIDRFSFKGISNKYLLKQKD